MSPPGASAGDQADRPGRQVVGLATDGQAQHERGHDQDQDVDDVVSEKALQTTGVEALRQVCVHGSSLPRQWGRAASMRVDQGPCAVAMTLTCGDYSMLHQRRAAYPPRPTRSLRERAGPVRPILG